MGLVEPDGIDVTYLPTRIFMGDPIAGLLRFICPMVSSTAAYSCESWLEEEPSLARLFAFFIFCFVTFWDASVCAADNELFSVVKFFNLEFNISFSDDIIWLLLSEFPSSLAFTDNSLTRSSFRSYCWCRSPSTILQLWVRLLMFDSWRLISACADLRSVSASFRLWSVSSCCRWVVSSLVPKPSFSILSPWRSLLRPLICISISLTVVSSSWI